MQFRVYYLNRRNQVAATLDIDTPTLDEARSEACAHNGQQLRMELWVIDDAMRWVRLIETTPHRPTRLASQASRT
jgi:hypothetical protein